MWIIYSSNDDLLRDRFLLEVKSAEPELSWTLVSLIWIRESGPSVLLGSFRPQNLFVLGSSLIIIWVFKATKEFMESTCCLGLDQSGKASRTECVRARAH